MSKANIKLLVGLGNPGSHYAKTRHNAGAWFIEQLCQQAQIVLTYKRHLHGKIAQWTDSHLANESYPLLVPSTFMNQSGQSVKAVLAFCDTPITDLLVIHDDLDLPPGIVKLKQGGGTGGHNGLKDIITSCRSNAFWRLRLGIGHPGHRDKVHDYVLGIPPLPEFEKIQHAIIHAKTVLPTLLQGDTQAALQQLNTVKKA
jgi:peptidyl-tRNA hydrolase, PTH1 family